LKPETESAPTRQDIGHEIGQDNVEIFGLDVHNPVFMISAAMAVAFVLGTLLFLDAAGPAFSNLRVWITSRFDWLFMIGSNIFVVFSLFIAYSKLGRVRFGGPDAKPRYGYPGWLAMLFAAGVGIGLMFFGVLEPVTHTLNPNR
jgi:BCCT family betaine/carnitine transporter